MNIRPTAETIEHVLAEMSDPDGTYYNGPLWWVSAYDEAGEWQSVGTGLSLEDAAAGAWINIYVPEHELGMQISSATVKAVPRQVPDGWEFEIDDMSCMPCSAPN